MYVQTYLILALRAAARHLAVLLCPLWACTCCLSCLRLWLYVRRKLLAWALPSLAQDENSC